MNGHTRLTEHRIETRTMSRCSVLGVLAVSYFALWVSVVGMREQGLRRAADIGLHPEAPLLFLLRFVLFGLAVWIGGGTSLSVGLRLVGWHRSAAKVSRVLPAPVRSLLFRAAGIGLVGSLMIQSGAVAAPSSDSQQSSTTAPQKERVTVKLGSVQQWPVLEHRDVSRGSNPPTLRVVGGQPNATSVPAPGKISLPANTLPQITTIPSTTIPATTIPATTIHATTIPATVSPIIAATTTSPRPVSSEPTRSNRQHSVKPGEHFWSIATAELQQNGSQVTEQDIARYWEQLIELNRSRLPDPTNPDLLRIGMLLDLPG